MFHGDRDDASYWTNSTTAAHPAEVERMHRLFSNPARVQALLDFGMQPGSAGLVQEWRTSPS